MQKEKEKDTGTLLYARHLAYSMLLSAGIERIT